MNFFMHQCRATDIVHGEHPFDCPSREKVPVACGPGESTSRSVGDLRVSKFRKRQGNLILIASLLGAFLALLAVAAVWERVWALRQARLARLVSRYNSLEIARRISRREVWQGQTEKQLLDSLGPPASIVLSPAPGNGAIWNYGPRRGNRFRLSVTIEDGLVTNCDPEQHP